MQAVDILPGRFAVCFLKHPDGARTSQLAAAGISFSIDDELVRERACGASAGRVCDRPRTVC
jgi:hypothetical protein